MKCVMLSIRPQWCEKICHEIGKDGNGKPIYEKRIEVRKTAPKETPFKAYIYATKPKKFYKCGAMSTSDELLWLANGKVEMGDGFKFWANGDEYQCLNGRIIGEFICDKVYLIKNQGNSFVVANEEQGITNEIARQSCLDYDDMVGYLGNKDGYGWRIADLKIYDKPKELREFYKPCPDKFHYCDICKYGSVILSDNEEEYALYHGGHYDTYETVCGNRIARPPQSYMFVEEIEIK